MKGCAQRAQNDTAARGKLTSGQRGASGYNHKYTIELCMYAMGRALETVLFKILMLSDETAAVDVFVNWLDASL